MSRLPGQYNNQYIPPQNYQQGYVQQPGLNQPGFNQQMNQPTQHGGLLGRKDRSSSSSSSNQSPRRKAAREQRRQLRRQQRAQQGGFVNDVRNKVDDALHRKI